MAFYARGVSLDWRNQKSRRAAFKLEASVSEFNTITQTLISEVRVGRLLRHLLIVRKKKNKVFKNLKWFINSWQIKGGKKVSPWSVCDYSGILMFQLARTPASAFLFFFGSTFFFFFFFSWLHTLCSSCHNTVLLSDMFRCRGLLGKMGTRGTRWLDILYLKLISARQNHLQRSLKTP